MPKGKYKIGEKAYKKKWNEEHPNYMKEYHKKWYKENKEKRRKYEKEWRKRNKEKTKEYSKEHYRKNKEKYKEVHKKYYEENKEKMLADRISSEIILPLDKIYDAVSKIDLPANGEDYIIMTTVSGDLNGSNDISISIEEPY